MMQPTARTHLETQGRFLRAHADTLVCDADVHVSDLAALAGPLRERYETSVGYYHGRPISAEDAVAEMDTAGVSLANIWQNPAATTYPGGEDENAEALLAANRYVAESARRFPGRFVPSGWTDPKSCGVFNAKTIVTTCVREFGFVLVKMNPAQNRFPIDSPEVLEVVDHIVELGAVPTFHYGADTPFTPAEGLETLLRRHPGHPLVAVHMGGGGAGYLNAESLYQQSRQLGLRYPNLRFILSAKRDTHIETALITYQHAGAPFHQNLFCASDAPYGRMSWNFGGYRGMFHALRAYAATHQDVRVRSNQDLFDDASVQGYLGGNFARFLAEASERLLAKHTT
ncbi:MAG: amidohydrolase family protein [Bryobacterales bacterium]|nr:amidohydrolase family protein [Bryobacterales bacterium]